MLIIIIIIIIFFFYFGIREDGITLLLKVFLSDILQIGSNYIHHPVLNCSDKSFFLAWNTGKSRIFPHRIKVRNGAAGFGLS